MTIEEREEALDVLTDMANALHLIPTTKQGKIFKMVLQELQKPAQKWIPVSERLPEENKRVLVSDVFGIYIGQFVDAEESWGGKHFINEHGMHSKSVIAWMPLPEPYTEGDTQHDY